MTQKTAGQHNRMTLSRVLGRTDIIAMGFGTMIGWSWVMMATTWLTNAGFLGAILAFGVGGGIILLIGLIYGELTAALPIAGGEFVFAYRAMGRKAAVFVGWLMAMAYLGVAAWEGIALATAVDAILPIPSAGPCWEIAGYPIHLSWALIGVFGALIITVLNFIGLKRAMLFQVMATAALIVIVLVVLFGGIAFGSVDNIGTLFGSRSGFYYVFLMVPAMMIGFEVVPQSSEEMNINPRSIGRMVIVCIVISMIWYLLMVTGTALAAPVEIRSSGIIPMADVGVYVFKEEMFYMVILFGGILGILTTWNGFFISATRLIFAMGRVRVIPPVFGLLHPKYKTPWAATLLVGGICVLTPLLGRNALIWFIDTSSFCALGSYVFVAISYVILKRREPELERPLRIRGGVVFGIFVLLITVVYLVLYVISKCQGMIIDPAFVITGIWMAMGIILFIISDLFCKEPSREEAELLVFGERFARRGGRRHEK